MKNEKVSGDNLPSIRIKPPGPESKKLAEKLIKYESPGVSSIATGKIPIFWKEALGANVVDADGNVYIGLTGAFAVVNVGHRNPVVVNAIKNQADKLLHCQGAVHPCIPRVHLTEKLQEISPGDLCKSIVLSTGAEAVEVAVKTARIYTGKRGIIAFHGGFHGKTFGALSLTSKKSYRNLFSPLIPGTTHTPYAYCYRCSFGLHYPECGLSCAKYLEYVIDDPSTGIEETAAILVEPIQGHGGWIVPPVEFISEIRRICNERNILMIVDEIITAFGRTGEWFAVNHSHVVPDIMVFGKGMASGFPISAAIARAEVMDIWKSERGESTHSSTFLGHPLGCAACLAGIKEIEEKDLVSRSAELGHYFMELLKSLQNKYSLIGEIRDKGLMIGIELVKDKKSKEPASEEAEQVLLNALERGVIINRGGNFGNVLKISPALVITKDQIHSAVEILDHCFYMVTKNNS
jgi:4-aminobutyrate aminotransferase